GGSEPSARTFKTFTPPSKSAGANASKGHRDSQRTSRVSDAANLDWNGRRQRVVDDAGALGDGRELVERLGIAGSPPHFHLDRGEARRRRGERASHDDGQAVDRHGARSRAPDGSALQ